MSTPQEYMDRLFSQASAPATPAAAAGRAAGLTAATGYGGESTAPGLEADIRTMSASALAQKYGYETAMQALGAQGQAAAQYNGLVGNQSRTAFGAVDDTVQGVADGFINSVMGIAGLATGALSDPGGSAVAQANQDYNDWSFLQRSGQMRSRLAAKELRNEMRQRDNDAAYEADKKENGDGLMTDLRRIGREALSGGAAMFDDGTTFGEDVSQAIGSLATAGPIGKGITAAGKGVAAAARATAPRLATKADDALAALTVSNPRLASVIQKTGQNAGTMTGITAMEAGGAYNSTMQDVASLPFNTLMQHSPVFAELVAQGMSLEEARDQVANAAAMQAAGWTGMMAAPLSALVARFEGNIFSSVPLGRGIANMASEAVEEGGIGLGGGLAQNFAVRDNADSTRSLTENVGEQLGQGAVLGAAAAGVVQAPRMAGQAVGAAAGKALDVVAGASDEVANREQAGAMQAQAVQVQKAVEEAAPTLQSLTPEGQAKWNEIREVYEFNAEEFFGGQAPPEVMEALGPAVNTPDAVSRMIKLAETTKDPVLKQQMALLAFEQTTYMDAVLEDPDTFTVAGVPEADAAMAAMASTMSTAWKGDSREKLRKQAAEIYRAQLEQGTPEQQVQAAENLVVADPLSAEPEQIRTVLQHAEDGIGNMSPQSRAALEAALEVVEADRAMRAQMESEGYEPTNNDKVSEQVRSSQEWGDGTPQSLGGHVARLLNFVRQGATNAAAEQADHLANFAQHMSNKVEALNAHYAAGPKSEPMGYEQYTKEGRWRTQKGGQATGLGVTPQSKKSLQNARAIEADARMTVNTLNAMADAFPQLGLSKLPLPKLADGLQGSMEEVLERHRPVKQGPAPIKRGQTAEPRRPAPVAEEAPKVEPTKQEEPAPVVRPSAAPEQVQAKKEEAPVPVVSRVTPEQAKRLSDEGLNERLQNLVGKRADGKATPEDNATFDVLDAEMIEREDASAVEVDLMAPVVEAQAASQKEITETVDDVTPVEDLPYGLSEAASEAVRNARNKVRELLLKLNFQFEETPEVGLSDLERIASKYLTGLHNDDPAFIKDAATALSYALYTEINEGQTVGIPRPLIESSLHQWLTTGQPPKVDKKIWARILEGFNKLMSIFRGSPFRNIEAALETTVNQIVTGADFSYKPKEGFGRLNFQQEMDANPEAVRVLKSLASSGIPFSLTGSVAYADQVPVYRKQGSPLHDVDLLVSPTQVDEAFEFFKNDTANWGDAGKLYEFSPGGNKVIGFVVVPVGHEIRNLKSTWNIKANNPERSYEVYNKQTGEKVGSYHFLRGHSETFTGIAGVTVDLIGDGGQQTVPQTFTDADGNRVDIAVSSYVGGFVAKLQMLRPKDVADFKAVVPPARNNAPAPAAVGTSRPEVNVGGRADNNSSTSTAQTGTPVEPTSAPVEETPAAAVTEEAPTATASEEESAPAPVEVEPKGNLKADPEMAQRFPNLLPTSWFRHIFRSTGENVVLAGRSIEELADLLNTDELSSLAPNVGPLEPEVVEGYQELLEDMLPQLREIMAQRMENFLKVPYKKGSNQKNLDVLRDSNVFEHTASGRVLQTAQDYGEDGVLYNEEILNAALLSATQWYLNAGESPAMSADEWTEALGVVVTADMANQLNSGAHYESAVDEVAQRLTRYLGIQGNNDAPQGMVQGVQFALAQEALESLIQAGAIRIENVSFTTFSTERGEEDTEATRAIRRVHVDKTKLHPGLVGEGGDSNVIERMLAKDPEGGRFYVGDEVPKPIATRHNQPRVLNTPEQMEVQRRMSEQPYTMNVPFNSFLSSLDKDGALHLFAEGPIAPDSLNKYDAEAREGRNLGVINALDAIQALTNRMKSVDEDLGKVPVRYAFNFTSVNRMMMLGDSNPQANKVMRALMLPTWSTVDVTQGQGRKNWILGVAQGLGLKVHKESFGKIEADLNKLLTTELKPVMDTLRGWQKNNRSFTAEQAKELRDQLKAAGVGDPAWGMFVLLEQARLDNAPVSERRKFTTPMYLEADGVTNGPIMGMGMLMTSLNSLNSAKLQALHKGGVAVGRTEERLNYADMHAEDKVDLYGSSGTYTPAAIAAMLSKADPKFRQITINMIKVMTDFYGAKKIGFKKVDGNVVMHIDRGMTKNPLTITLYGSGARGIAGNFVDEMKVEYHKRMSELRATLPKDAPRSQVLRAYADRYGADSLKNLEFMQKNLILNTRKEGLKIVSNLDGSADWRREFRPLPESMQQAGDTTKDMTFSKLDEINMASFIQHLFVEPLRNSITQAVGGDVMGGMETLREVTGAQSELAVAYFEKALNDRLDAKLAADPNFRKADFLTGKELDEIFANMEKIFPRIEINGMTFDLMGKMKSFLKNVYVSDVLKGTYKTKENRKIEAKTFGPASLGVGGIPSMIIGSGDASMILKAYLANSMENTLSVYDGVHLPMDKVQDQSLVLNQQAYAAMMSNPIKAVWDSAKVTLSEGNREALAASLVADLKSFPQGVTAKALEKSAFGKFLRASSGYAFLESGTENVASALRTGASDSELTEIVANQMAVISEWMTSAVEQYSEMIEINHKVVASLGSHIDQMASGDAPARIEPNQDASGQDLSYDEIAEEAMGRVKTLMLESENEAIRRMAEDASVSAVATTGLPALAPSSVGAKLPGGATLMSVEHLLERSRATDLTPVQKEMMREALRSGALTGWSFVTGTPEQLSAYSTSAGKALSPEADSVVHGAIDLETKTVFLPETANETLVHEMVHAATIQNVINALTGEKVSNRVMNAVRNLEALLEDFMAIQPARMPAGAIVAHANARATIERHLLAGTPEGKASAINEMMAWVLGNKSLQEALSKKSAPKRVVEFTQKLFNAVKRMFWGNTTMSAPASDFVSQLLFNSKVLANVALKTGTKGGGSLQHSTQDSALRRLKDDLSRRLDGFTEMVLDPRSMKSTVGQVRSARIAAKVRLNELEAGGFRLAGEARDVSETLMTVLGTTMQVDPSVMNTTQRVYDHVMQNLTPQSFEDIGVDRDQASEMYDALSGKQSQGRDPLGRSLLLPSFLAMALVNPELRQVLSKMPAITKTKVKSETLDQTLDNLGTASMDALDRSLSGLSGKERSAQDMIDSLQAHVAAAAAEEGSWLVSGSQNVQGVVDKSNDYLVSLLGRVDQAAVSGIASLRADPNSKIRRVTADALEVLRAGLTDEGANAASEAATVLFNQKGVWKWARDLATDIIGRTDLNAPLFDMIKIVRTKVQQMRQHYRDDVPAIFHKEFKNAPSAQQYAAMSRVLGQTDVASLLGTMTVAQVQGLLSDPASLAQALASAKSAMISAVPKSAAREVEFKANQLAHYLMSGEPGVGLLRNSYAIAMKSAKDTSNTVAQAIDSYVTLAALSQANPKDLAAVQELMEEDSAAVMFMAQYNKQQLDWDRERMEGNELAKLNHFKGYLPNPVKPGQKLVVRPVSEHADLVMRGYTQLDLYQGSSAERIKEPQAYYFSPVDGQAVFNQGLIQNTQQTVGGVQLNSGYSLNHTVAGRITDMKRVSKITNEIATNGDKGLEALMPVYDAEGVVIAYERSIRRDMQNKIVDQLHYGKALGMWRGRQAEERAGEEINKAVVQQLKNRYRKASATEKATEFINLRSMEAYNDPQIRDAANLFTKDVVEMFAKEFGENGPIWIERTMLKDVIGYRAATVGDMWTGTSRLSPVAVDTIKDVMTYFMDKKAYQYAVNAERFVQGVVTDARVLIAVKSVVVPAVNIVSNMLHLISRGVPLHKLGDTRKKLNEVHQYVQSEIERVEAETRMTSAISGSLEHRRLVNRLQAIEDSQRRLSIWPLIEAGEFSSVAEVGLSHEDLMLSRGRLSDYIETQLDKLPTPVGTVAHNLLLSKHTALFRGLQRTVQYGDFVAKAVLFDHLVDSKKMTAKQALARITEEFVHYDRLPGRTRGYLESVGLLWFYNFKLRSVKVAFSTMRNNPLHTLLAVMAPTPDFLGSAGLPVEDNALSKLLGGSLGYSIGPGQGINSIGLNPWLNAIN